MRNKFVFLLAVLCFCVALSSCGHPEPAAADDQEYTSQGTPIVHDDLDDIYFINTPESTCFSRIGYNHDFKILVVTFRDSGSTYRYLDVPQSVWDNLRTAESKGGYYNDKIKGNYDCDKIE